MRFFRRIDFGLGGIVSVILVYFIYLYSKSHGWWLLTWISGAYLVVVLFFVGLMILIILLPLMILFFALLAAKLRGKPKRKKKKEYIDVKYQVK